MREAHPGRPKIKPSFTIAFSFDGGLAARGQLNFYESGRYRYAASRILYTLEHFRQTGEVLERLNKRVSADFRVSAAEAGSFLDPIFLYAAPIAADPNVRWLLANIPFDKVFAWALDKVIPTRTNNEQLLAIVTKQLDVIGQIANVNIAREATAQERERTAQLQAVEATRQLGELKQLLAYRDQPLQEDLTTAGKLSSILASAPNVRLDDDEDSADFISNELAAEIERARLCEGVPFDDLDQDLETKLTDRLRKIMPDLGVPLKRSAVRLNIGLDESAVPVASLNDARIKQITAVSRDDQAVTMTGAIVRLDKDFGFGRFRPQGTRNALPFVTPREVFSANRDSFIRSFGASQVTVVGLPFRDGIGNIVRFMMLQIL
jgi:hypothetical protein